MTIISPYTRMSGDSIHGWHPELTPVWVRLEALVVRAPNSRVRVVAHGLDMTGEARGFLSGWFPSAVGDWMGVVNYEIRYADGRRDGLRLADQLVPAYALRPRTEKAGGRAGHKGRNFR